jgi:hypothetical protein
VVFLGFFGIELTLEFVSVIGDQPSQPAALACRASYTGIRTVPYTTVAETRRWLGIPRP